MRSLIVLTLLSFGLFSCTFVHETARTPVDEPVVDRIHLQSELLRIISGDLLRYSTPAIVIYMPDYNDTIFHHNGNALLRPASNQKLITSLAALYTLGPQYNFRTVVYRDGPIENGILKGNIILRGFGNPLLSVNDLRDFVESLHEFGINKIEGTVLVDENYFDTERWPAGWMWNFDPAYYAPYVSALAISQNTAAVHFVFNPEESDRITISVEPPTAYINIRYENQPDDSVYSALRLTRTADPGSNTFILSGNPSPTPLTRIFYVSVKEPALFAGTLLSELLASRSMIDTILTMKADSLPDPVPLIQINTPIDTVLQYFNKQSDNLTGEMLLKVMSAELNNTPGSRIDGARIVETVLRSKGIIHSPIRIVDGSGLSYHNLITAFTITRLLATVRTDPTLFPLFYESLTIMGTDGTLRNRLKDTLAQERFRGKTGTLGGISSLSGYATTLNGETVICVMFFQNFADDSALFRKLQDDIIKLLVQFRYAGMATVDRLSQRYNGY
jgi:serine-type D-Ala-D-Ala carboxypeptidase/endopeptidase (penicillin-binding protein 4)